METSDKISFDSAEILYQPHMYCLDYRKKKLLPNDAGIYVIFQGKRIYCGPAKKLSIRVPGSVREQGFGRTVFFFPAKFLDIKASNCILPTLKYIEEHCIAALYAIIRGNGLPLHLTNFEHARLLSYSEYSRVSGQKAFLPIEIVQTVLYRLGFPWYCSELPIYEMIHSDMPEAIAAENAGRWGEILAAELKSRKSLDHPKSPLVCEKLK